MTLIDSNHSTSSSDIELYLEPWQGHLESFYRGLLARFLVELDAALDDVERSAQIGFDRPAISHAVAHEFVKMSLAASVRTLVYEMHSGQLATSTEGGKYDTFSRWLDSGGDEELLGRYPVLASDLARIRRQMIALAAETMRHAAADAQLLVRAGLITSATRVHSIEFTDGDSHKDGRRVAIVAFDGGRVVHKPRSLVPDVFVTSLGEIVNERLPGDAQLSFADVLDRGEYGWQQYLTTVTEVSEQQAATHFTKIGVATAFFRAIGCGDLHYENVMATSEGPVFFDLETFAAHPHPQTSHDLDARVLGKSILAPMILPCPMQGSVFDMSMAGIGAVGKQTSSFWNTYDILGPGTDEYRLERHPTTIEHTVNMVYVGGVVADPSTYENEVAVGISLGRRAVARCADALRRQTQQAPPRLGARQVLRPTSVYSRFLEAATHPKYLTSEQARRELLERLGPCPRVPASAGAAVGTHEVEAMLDGDIPYFWATFESGSLIANGSAELSGVHERTLKAAFAEALHLGSDEGTAAGDRHALRLSTMTNIQQPWDTHLRKPGRYLSEVFNDPHPSVVAARIGQAICDLASWDEQAERCTLITANISPAEGAVTIGCGRPSLYEDGGTIAVLRQLAEVGGDARARAHADGLAATISTGTLGESEPVRLDGSAFCGRFSAALVAAATAPSIHPNAAQLTRLGFGRAFESDDCDQDFIGGRAGLARVLATHPVLGAVDVTVLPFRALEVDLVTDVSAVKPGLAHGTFGSIYGAGALAERAGRHDWARQVHATALACAARATARLDEAPDLSWCSGSAGEVLAVVDALTRLRDGFGLDASAGDEPIERLIRAARAMPMMDDLSMCHGVSGVVTTLMELHLLVGTDELRDIAYELWDRSMTRVCEVGYSGGLADSTGLTGYLLGLSGVAEAALVLHNGAQVVPPLWSLRAAPGGHHAD